MKEHRLQARARKKFRVTTDSKHSLPVAPNLLKRNFQADAANKVWTGDITCCWTECGWARRLDADRRVNPLKHLKQAGVLSGAD
jgi:transposase InsO family protein